MDAARSFQEQRHVYLSGAVSRDKCEELTNHMFRLFEEGKLEKDPQCPLSDSIYGDPIFDNLAASLAPALSKQLGVEVLPTYTYCRIYRPGEILVRHRDRPSCEISGTMTLGFDDSSGIWPIFPLTREDVPHRFNVPWPRAAGPPIIPAEGSAWTTAERLSLRRVPSRRAPDQRPRGV